MGRLTNLNPAAPIAHPVTVVQQQVSAPAQISLLANNWFDLGILNDVNSGDTESIFITSLYIQYITAGQTHPYWQYAGVLPISPVFWKAAGTPLVKYVDMEGHAETDFTLSFKLGVGQKNRMVQLFFPISLSARLVRATFIRLR
jgi:hypothetical protein